jgi:hypothetical protein
MPRIPSLLAVSLGIFFVHTTAAALTVVPVTVHLATDEGHPVTDEGWVDEFIDRANQLYEPASIQFEVKARPTFDSPGPLITKVAERHALAEYAEPDGTIHFFVVARLADKEIKDKWISGVHWRYVGKQKEWRGRRYIILSRRAARVDTPAHELGHYFGNGHTKDPGNLMKSLPRDDDCSLSKVQIRRIKKKLNWLVRKKVLKVSDERPSP